LFAATNSPAATSLPFPFDLELGREIALVAAGGGLYASSFYFQSIKASPTSSGIDSSAIPFFDRLYVTGHSAAMGTVADGMVVVAALLPAVALPGMSLSQTLDTGVMYVETMALAIGASAALKSIVFRYRPYAYAASPSDFSNPDIASSFPSNHSTLAFASAVFAGYLFDRTHPDSPYRWAVWGAGLGLATATASIRVASGDHFLSDVVTGASLGALCGFVVPWLHTVSAEFTATLPGGSKLGFEPLPDGMALKLSFAP
jgi:undecaprenyl-diphosphatase